MMTGCECGRGYCAAVPCPVALRIKAATMGRPQGARCRCRRGYHRPMTNAYNSAGWAPRWLAAGFRPFFLLAGVHALIAVPLWMHAFTQGGVLHGMPLMYWHAHEMIFGF